MVPSKNGTVKIDEIAKHDSKSPFFRSVDSSNFLIYFLTSSRPLGALNTKSDAIVETQFFQHNLVKIFFHFFRIKSIYSIEYICKFNLSKFRTVQMRQIFFIILFSTWP